MAKFRVRWGYRGSRLSIIKAGSVVEARNKWRKLHPKAKYDSTNLIR